MGHIVHHAVVVTSFSEMHIALAWERARQIFGASVTKIVESGTNGYRSFLVAPDGSKCGWGESEAGDDRRDEFITWMTAERYEDDSSPLEWCEVSYGSDDRTAKITRHEWSGEDEASASLGMKKV